MGKHAKYARYIARHKWFVFVAGVTTTRAPLWRLIIHDWSKFLPGEWLPYASYFYGYKRGEQPPKAKDAFDRAWLHHQHFNLHHYQHWILREDSGDTKVLQMPDHFVREMIADWMGAGRVITGTWDAPAWYLKNADKILLHPTTLRRVRALLGLPPEQGAK